MHVLRVCQPWFPDAPCRLLVAGFPPLAWTDRSSVAKMPKAFAVHATLVRLFLEFASDLLLPAPDACLLVPIVGQAFLCSCTSRPAGDQRPAKRSRFNHLEHFLHGQLVRRCSSGRASIWSCVVPRSQRGRQLRLHACLTKMFWTTSLERLSIFRSSSLHLQVASSQDAGCS